MMVRSTTTGRDCYIPTNYTAKVTSRYSTVCHCMCHKPHLSMRESRGVVQRSIKLGSFLTSVGVSLCRWTLARWRQMFGTRLLFCRVAWRQPLPAVVSLLLQWGNALWCRSSGFSKSKSKTQWFSVLFRWLFTGLSRFKAVELLMHSHNQTGAFLIRDSETNRGQRLVAFFLSKSQRCLSILCGWVLVQ